ncbi:hypothetical protein HYR99_10025 [Candidatus Poribacteria bacterium]|nr:hypothetical protein [Candidatus Poribacteria bacterium]
MSIQAERKKVKNIFGSYSRNCEVHFDVVVITGNGIPDKDLSLPVDPKAKLATRWATIKQRK